MELRKVALVLLLVCAAREICGADGPKSRNHGTPQYPKMLSKASSLHKTPPQHNSPHKSPPPQHKSPHKPPPQHKSPHKPPPQHKSPHKPPPQHKSPYKSTHSHNTPPLNKTPPKSHPRNIFIPPPTTTRPPPETRPETFPVHPTPPPVTQSLPEDACPADHGNSLDGYRHRIANGRYYISHHHNRIIHTPSWDKAFDLCENFGMKLAKVDHLTTFWHIMNFWRTHNKGIYKDTWYWIAAKYDKVDQVYKWHTDNKTATDLVKYTNYFYRVPRPTGLGAHSFGNYTQMPGENHAYYDQCLTLAFPWPIINTKVADYGTFGFNPTMDERVCSNKKLRHVLCEADTEKCSATDTDPYVLSEGNKKYFDEGNFIFGNRLYIANWKQRNFEDSKNYCEGLGLELYNPDITDHCLIPYIKLWARNVSTSQWWTSLNYTQGDWKYFDFDNFDTTNVTGRSREVCVALSHHFEFKVQMHCPNELSVKCQWHFLTYAPANCNNYQGVICQHKDSRVNPKRTCSWNASWIREKGGITKAIKETALLSFGFETNKQYLRSTYKQTFGSLYCIDGYSMVRARDEIWWREIPEAVIQSGEIFEYDFRETYWVVDEEKFKKPRGSNCTISVPSGSSVRIVRKTFKVPCTEWHFYLCKKSFKSLFLQRPEPPPGYEEPQWNWNFQGATPRPYSF